MSMITLSEIRDRDELIAYLAEGNQVEYLYFWGHTAKDANILGKECLSHWTRIWV